MIPAAPAKSPTAKTSASCLTEWGGQATRLEDFAGSSSYSPCSESPEVEHATTPALVGASPSALRRALSRTYKVSAYRQSVAYPCRP